MNVQNRQPLEQDDQQNSVEQLHKEFETAISELTPDERKELLKMARRRKTEKTPAETDTIVEGI